MCGQVLKAAAVQVVQDNELRAAIIKQAINEVTADEPRAAGDDYLSGTLNHSMSITGCGRQAVGRRLKNR